LQGKLSNSPIALKEKYINYGEKQNEKTLTAIAVIFPTQTNAIVQFEENSLTILPHFAHNISDLTLATAQTIVMLSEAGGNLTNLIPQPAPFHLTPQHLKEVLAHTPAFLQMEINWEALRQGTRNPNGTR
jgi:hypothetical protein